MTPEKSFRKNFYDKEALFLVAERNGSSKKAEPQVREFFAKRKTFLLFLKKVVKNA